MWTSSETDVFANVPVRSLCLDTEKRLGSSSGGGAEKWRARTEEAAAYDVLQPQCALFCGP